jgi:hypothetical protein
MKLPSPRAFRLVRMMLVAVVVAPFFTVIIITTGLVVGVRAARLIARTNMVGAPWSRSSDGCGRSSAESIARELGRVHGVVDERV